MGVQEIFALQFLSSLLVIGCLAWWELAPRLNKLSAYDALFWLVLPHAFRYIGMVFLVPGVVAQPLPDYFAPSAAYGDLTASALALLALILLRRRAGVAISVVWLANVVGLVDLINALRHVEVVSSFGAAWFIPTMFVPLLLVTHVLIFVQLLRPTQLGETNEAL